jgi:hypothetical protein
MRTANVGVKKHGTKVIGRSGPCDFVERTETAAVTMLDGVYFSPHPI